MEKCVSPRRRIAGALGVAALLLGLAACAPTPTSAHACPIDSAGLENLLGSEIGEASVSKRSDTEGILGLDGSECTYPISSSGEPGELSEVSFTSASRQDVESKGADFFFVMNSSEPTLESMPDWGSAAWIEGLEFAGSGYQVYAKFEAGDRFWKMQMVTAAPIESLSSDDELAVIQTGKDVVNAIVSALG